MKLQVCVGDETFQVEIDDLHARPIVARVEGEAFAVWPESGQVSRANGKVAAGVDSAEVGSAIRPPMPAGTARTGTFGSLAGGSAVRAPIPGVILSILVKEADTVAAG